MVTSLLILPKCFGQTKTATRETTLQVVVELINFTKILFYIILNIK